MSHVAVVMVIRDDAPLAERALRSVAGYVDEMIVFDLGSCHGTAERLRICGARVVEGVWRREAAAVRNAALATSDADWNLVLEAEEWLDDGGMCLEELANTRPDHIGLAEVVHTLTQALMPTALSPRLLPRGARYVGAVTDEVAPTMPFAQTSLVIGTDHAASGRWRQDRTLIEAALLQGLAVRRDDPALLHRLGAEERFTGRIQEAADTYENALALTPAAAPWRHAVVTEALETLTAAGRFRAAVTLTNAEMPTWQHSPDFTFLVGDLFFGFLLATPALAPELAPLVATSWQRCLELGDRPDLAGSVHGRGSFLAAQSLYVLALTVGDESEARRWSEHASQLRLVSLHHDGPRLLG